jgi:hypothetical protein
VYRLIDGPHTSPAQLTNDAIAGDSAARFEIPSWAWLVPRTTRTGALPNETVDEFQPLEGGSDVLTQVGIAGRELFRFGCLSSLDEGQIRLDGLAQAFVAVRNKRRVFRPVNHRRTSTILRGGLRVIASDA